MAPLKNPANAIEASEADQDGSEESAVAMAVGNDATTQTQEQSNTNLVRHESADADTKERENNASVRVASNSAKQIKKDDDYVAKMRKMFREFQLVQEKSIESHLITIPLTKYK